MKFRSLLSTVAKAAMLSCFALVVVQSAQTKGGPRTKKVGYSSVQPIIQAKCVSCHNDDQHPEDVNLSSYEKVLKSGEGGSIVSARHPEKSKLLQYVDGSKKPRMPFKQAPLSKKEISAIRAWIAAGARK